MSEAVRKSKKPGLVKDPAAVALGRRGGQARAKTMTAKERSQSARRAALARWARKEGQ